jgi:hypothetical protein
MGRQRIITGNFEVATGETDSGDIIVLARIPANATVQAILICGDALDTGSALIFDVGLYRTTGVVLDADAYDTDFADLQSAVAPASAVDARYLTATDATDMGQRAWESGGLTTDPGGQLDIALTVTTAPATIPTAATLGYEIRYTID